jgi:protocatechuate 3,4-dioxygenase beta subunit
MPRSSELVMCLTAVCACAFSQPASLEGVVINSATGEPVLRAHISLRLMSSGSPALQKRFGALTTAEGKFSIAGIDAGRYSLSVEKTGFVSPRQTPDLNLQAGDTKNDLKFALVPTGAITGRVLNAEGKPVENIRVEVDRGWAGEAVTDDNGKFRIGGLNPGRYKVRAMPRDLPIPPEIRTDGTKEVHYSRTYYPGALLAKSAARVEARAGSETSGVDIRLLRTPIVRVSGTVSGLPPGTQNAYIELLQRHGTTIAGNVKGDGTFAIWKLDPGTYTLAAVTDRPDGTHMQSSPAEIEVTDRNVDHISLNVILPMDLSGHVVFDDERARPAQAVQVRLVFIAPDGSFSKTIDVDANDSFRVTGLLPDRYRIVPQWGFAYVRSMQLGPAQIDGSGLDLRNGAAGTSLAMVVSSAMATINGTVSDDKGPAAHAAVVIMQEAPDTGWAFRFAEAKPDGTYTLTGVPPGKYKIAAVDQGEINELSQLGDLDDYLDMETIEVSPNDKLTKDLKSVKP